MTVPDIVKEVFADHADGRLQARADRARYRKWTYCVQYRETDFNFVSRLLEHEGIYYYFRHTDGHNTMVLTDSCSEHAACAGLRDDPVHRARASWCGRSIEHISSWEFSREVQPGVYVHDDYDLERPSVDLQDAEGRCRARTRRATTRSSTIRATTCRRPDGEQLRRRCASTSSAAQFETAQRRRPTRAA